VPVSALSLRPVSAPPAHPSPVPACVRHDRSEGYRAKPTLHAIRRFADRVLGLETILEGLTDREALDVLRSLDADVCGIREWLAFYGWPGARYGARLVCIDGYGLLMAGDRVVTLVVRGRE